MHKKTLRLLVAAVICIGLVCCVKSLGDHSVSPTAKAVEDAQKFFTSQIVSKPLIGKIGNYRASAAKTVDWSNASVSILSVGEAVIAPIHFKDPLYVSSSANPSKMYLLDQIAKLVIYKDARGNYECRVLTFVPDSNCDPKHSVYSGTVFNENWQGASISKPWQIGNLKKTTMVEGGNIQPDLAEVTVCTTIEGYNYAADDPSNGYYWSESSCNTYFLQGGGDEYGGPGPGDVGGIHGGGGGGGGGVTITIPPPSNPISNIKAYFNCFVNGSSPTTSFTVTVCVDQPDPGTRVPWTFTSGGVPGSSAAGNAVNVGHTFLILTENNQGNITTRNVGFYPSGFVMPSPPSDAQAQGVLNDDEGHPYNVSLTVNVTGTQFFGILGAVSLGNNAGYVYNINSYNCTTFVIDALNNNGVTLPSTKGTWLGGGGNDPGDLGQDIMGMSLKSGETRSTNYGAHPNTGSCN